MRAKERLTPPLLRLLPPLPLPLLLDDRLQRGQQLGQGGRGHVPQRRQPLRRGQPMRRQRRAHGLPRAAATAAAAY
jgi:hypothetical protein